MGNATRAVAQGIMVHQALMERDSATRRTVLSDVVTRLEGFGVDLSVIEHFRVLRDVA